MCVRWFLNSCLSFFCISPKQIETKSSNISQQAQFLEFGTMRIESLSICSSNLLIKPSSCKSYVHRFLLYFDFNTICWENCLRRQLFINHRDSVSAVCARRPRCKASSRLQDGSLVLRSREQRDWRRQSEVYSALLVPTVRAFTAVAVECVKFQHYICSSMVSNNCVEILLAICRPSIYQEASWWFMQVVIDVRGDCIDSKCKTWMCCFEFFLTYRNGTALFSQVFKRRLSNVGALRPLGLPMPVHRQFSLARS